MKKSTFVRVVVIGVLLGSICVEAHDDSQFFVVPVPIVVNADYPAPVSRTGQSTSYSAGDDGDLEKGVASPSPRFTNNGDGTVTDNLTGLVWLRNAGCYGRSNWNTSLVIVKQLAGGSGRCSLLDDSLEGEWRLPNLKELSSLVNSGYKEPALSNAASTDIWKPYDAFVNVKSTVRYWSSSTRRGNQEHGWYVDFSYGQIDTSNKSTSYTMWPVRDGN